MTTFTLDQVRDALGGACSDIASAAKLPDEGVIDALNLLVNAALHYLGQPQERRTLDDAVAAMYEEVALNDVLSWIAP